MKQPSTAASPPGPTQLEIARQASAEHANGKLLIHFALKNGGDKPLYVFDRPWMLQDAKVAVADPNRAYRFYQNGVLRILLGQAPMPQDRMVAVHYDPHATRLAPHQTVIWNLDFEIPVAEYNVYFDDLTVAKYERQIANSIEITVQYVSEDPGLTVSPSPVIPGAFKVRAAHGVPKVDSVHLHIRDHQTEVLRRTDQFERAQPE